MNNEPKVLLTVFMEGGTLVRQGKPVIVETPVYAHFRTEEGKVVKKVIKKRKTKVYKYEQSTCALKTKLTRDAFDFMTSDTYPAWFSKPQDKKAWKKMSKEDRLKTHLLRICQNHGGKNFTYQILDD